MIKCVENLCFWWWDRCSPRPISRLDALKTCVPDARPISRRDALKTCVSDVWIDAGPISRRDAADAAVAGAPAIYHLQALNQHAPEIQFQKGRNTFSQRKKYTFEREEIQNERENVYHLLALSPHFLCFQKRRNMNNWAHPHPRHSVLGNASDTMVSWTVEAVQPLKRDRLLVENLLLS